MHGTWTCGLACKTGNLADVMLRPSSCGVHSGAATTAFCWFWPGDVEPTEEFEPMNAESAMEPKLDSVGPPTTDFDGDWLFIAV